MIFDGCHFEYGNFNSRQYDLVFAHLDTSIDTRTSGEIETRYFFNKRTLSRYVTGIDYTNSPINLEVELVTLEPRVLDRAEKRLIEKALFNRHSFQKLYIDVNDDAFCEAYERVNGVWVRSYLNCRFTNPSRIEDGLGRVIGYRCTMECDSLMFTQDPITVSYTIPDSSEETVSNITVKIDTDIDEYVYPKVTINMGSTGGGFTIYNNTDDSTRLTRFEDVGALATVIMKGEINYVSDQYYERFYDRNFIRLLDGDNNLTIVGNVASITFEYSARRAL